MKIFLFLLIVIFFGNATLLKCQTRLWQIYTNNGIGFIDENGKIIIKTDFDEVDNHFSDGLAWFKEKKKMGYIDTCGNIAFLLKNVRSEFKEGLAPYFYNHKLCFINKSGKIVIYPKYLDYYLGSELPNVNNPIFSEGLAVIAIQVKPNCGTSGFIYVNKKGENEFNKIFIKAGKFSEGIAFVKINDKETGYINKNGELVIKLENEQYGDEFSESFASVTDRDMNKFFINKEGKRICESIFRNAYPFSNGLAKIAINDKYGFINTSGLIVIKPIYDSASSFYKEKAFVGIFNVKNGRNKYSTCIIDKNGKIIIGPFEDIWMHYSENGVAYCTRYLSENAKENLYLNQEGIIIWRSPILK